MAEGVQWRRGAHTSFKSAHTHIAVTGSQQKQKLQFTTMATERRRQRKNKLKKRAPRKDATAGPTTVQDIPDHVLELILHGLDSSVCLIRAAAACKRWRRVVADAGFLSRFRSIHGHHIAGHYHTVDPYYGLLPPASGNAVFVPSSPLAIDSRRFSLDFLPDSDSWELTDCRGSLLLLSKKRTRRAAWWGYIPDLVVCEPLTRRYQGILRPADLNRHRCLGVFLLDGADADRTTGRIGMSNFKVMCSLYKTHRGLYNSGAPLACVFSSGSDGGWRIVQRAAPGDVDLGAFEYINFVGRANGSLYWGIEEDGEIEEECSMLVLDETTAEFSTVLFPEDIRGSYDKRTFRVIGSEDGALRVVRSISSDLKVFARLPGSGEWVLEKLVRLPEVTRGLPGRKKTYFQRVPFIVAADARYVLVTPQEKRWLFSVELDTVEVERDHQRNRYAGASYPYELPWPPALKICADHCSGRRRRR